jgi:hypothetical protein
MVGATSGYYEPEWDEQSAWEALTQVVYDHFTDWSEEEPKLTRSLNSPREILQAATEMLANAEPEKALRHRAEAA